MPLGRRERVLTALQRQQPDRVPFLEVAIARPLAEALAGKADPAPHEVADALGLDGLGTFIWAPDYAESATNSEGRSFQGAGRIRSRADLAMIDLPDPDDERLYAPLAGLVRRYRGEYALWVGGGIGWQPVLINLGLEGFCYALADDPGIIHEILRPYTDWYRRVWTNAQELGIDFLWLGDDIAYNQGPMFSPTVFRELFLPYGRRVAEVLHVPWAYHSDGNLLPILDDLLSLGMAALHPIQPGAMDIEELKRQYGQRICLWGNIDLEYTLTRGSPEEVRQLVRRRIDTVGRGGSYIIGSSNSIPSYCKPENVLAMAAAVREYGGYPTG